MMLARHAESLFWAGRQIERAEDTARMLDVTYHGLLEAMPWEAERSWKDLLKVLWLDRPVRRARAGRCGPRRCRSSSCSTPTTPGAIVSAVAGARENARAARELISSELWEAINSFHLELRSRNLRADVEARPHELYEFVKRSCQTISGRGGGDDAARRRLAVPPARLDARAGRDDLPPPRRPLQPAGDRRRHRRVPPLAADPQVGVGLRGVPPPLPGVDGPGRRGRVPAPVAHVPALGALLPAGGRERPRPARGRQRHPGPARSGSSAAPAPTSSSSTPTSCSRATCTCSSTRCSAACARSPRRWPSSTSAAPRSTTSTRSTPTAPRRRWARP